VLSGARVRRALDEHRDLERFFELHEISAAGDLLWFFYGGRDAALALAGDAPPNTDLSLYSEVRLAALGRDLGPEASPGPLLAQHAVLDPRPYLDPADAGQTVTEAGRYFLRFDRYPQAQAMGALLGAMGETFRADELGRAIALQMAQGGAQVAPDSK